MLKKLLCTAMVATALLAAAPASATVLTVGSGWQSDSVGDTTNPSALSPWTFTLADSAVFRLSDCCIAGDVYSIYLGDTFATAVLLGQSSFTTDGATVDDYAGVQWSDTTYSRFWYGFDPGSYTLWVTGDGVGGLPAGFGVQLAAVPEPGTWAMMIFGFGVAGFAMRRNRKRNAIAALA